MRDVAREVSALVAQLFPGGRVLAVEPLAPDAGPSDDTHKGAGYGAPIKVRLVDRAGAEHAIVLRTASANDFGHDRRSDRAQNLLLAYDTFAAIPGHVAALDVGAITGAGRLVSLRDAGELYLVTSYAEGSLYADDLRRIARDGHATALDLERCTKLAAYLVDLHGQRGGRPAVYARAIRDLVGHGEGIFGIVDAYPKDTEAAPPERLQGIERRVLEWRWRLRARSARLSRIHGDFHPFNIVFSGGARFTLLDASRGCQGDPADDVTSLAVNYFFFALGHPGAWAGGFERLWEAFFATYLDGSGDRELLEVAPPFLAWRCLVVACPAFYPALGAPARDALLTLAERALDAGRLDPALAGELAR